LGTQTDAYDEPLPRLAEPIPLELSDPYLGRVPEVAPGLEPHPIMPSDSSYFSSDHLYNQAPSDFGQLEKPGHHQFPFDPIKTEAETRSGFPYAIPEDPRPPRSLKPLFAAFALAVAVFIVAVLIPLQETLRLRNELEYLENSIAAHVSVDAILILEQARVQTQNEIDARQADIARINNKRAVAHEFYLPLPALMFIPEILERSGLTIDSIEASEHQILMEGRIDDHRAFGNGMEYLREYSPYRHFIDIFWDWRDISDDDAYGLPEYYVVITLLPNTEPFRLNGQMGGRSR